MGEVQGYYIFHTKNHKPFGLNTNEGTGVVCYHDGHGELEKIIKISRFKMVLVGSL